MAHPYHEILWDLRYKLTHGTPAFVPMLGLIAGIVFTYQVGGGYIAALILILPVPFLLWIHKYFYAGAITMAALGCFVTSARMPAASPNDEKGAPRYYVGRVVDVINAENTTNYVIDNCYVSTNEKKWQYLPGVRLQVKPHGKKNDFILGDIIAMHGRAHPAVHAPEVPYEYDNSDYMRYSRISGLLDVAEQKKIKKVGYKPTWVQRFNTVGSNFIADKIRNIGLDYDTEVFLQAVLAGQRPAMDFITERNFRASGVAHILVLSGMHISLIISIISFLLIPLKLARWGSIKYGRTLWLVLILLSTWVYSLAVGLSPSVSRAAVAISISTVTIWTLSKRVRGNIICASVLLVLIVCPEWLWSPAFILSVCATTAIYLLAYPFCKRYYKRWYVTVSVVPLAGFVGTSIPAMMFFHTLPIWFLPANIAGSFMSMGIIVAGAAAAIIATVLCLFNISCTPLAWLIDNLYTGLNATMEWFSKWTPTYSLYLSWWHYLAIGVLILMAILLIRRHEPQTKRFSIRMSLAALILLCVPPIETVNAESFMITQGKYVSVLHRRGDKAELVISPCANNPIDITMSSSYHYTEYMHRHNIDSIVVTNATNDGAVRLDGHVLQCGPRTYVYAGATRPIACPQNATLIVEFGFTGDICQYARSIKADTVILSPSLNYKRLQRYKRALQHNNIPTKTMRPMAVVENI